MDNLQTLLRRNLQFLGFVGSNPYTQNALSYVLKIKTIISLTTLLALTSSQVFLDWDGVATLSKIDYLPPTFLAFAKMIFLMFNMKAMKKLVDGFGNFWPLDKFGPKINREMQRIFDKTYKIMKIYGASCLSCGLLIFVLPLVLNTKNLIFPIHEPCDLHEYPCFEILYTWQSIMMFTEMTPVIIGLDLMFLSLILHPYVAIELLKKSFSELVLLETRGIRDKAKENLKEIVDQHNVILDSINELNELFSMLLMVQFWCALVSQIFALYMLTEEGMPPDSTRISRYGIIYVVYLFQLLIYSFGGMLLIEQTTSIANEAYAIDWYVQTQPNLRRSLSFIILRSQRPNKIKVGNMADLDLVSFVTIVKNALSVYALLRQLQEEKLEN